MGSETAVLMKASPEPCGNYEVMGPELKLVWLKWLPENDRYRVEAWVPQD